MNVPRLLCITFFSVASRAKHLQIPCMKLRPVIVSTSKRTHGVVFVSGRSYTVKSQVSRRATPYALSTKGHHQFLSDSFLTDSSRKTHALP